MRVFVTCIGRCGSVSFRAACQHMTNYRTGHETRNGLLEYPDQFIEVNPQLRNCITTINGKYPSAKWVHLIREPQSCIPSLVNLEDGQVMRSYAMLYSSVMLTSDLSDIAYRYYWAENDVIRAQLNLLVAPANRMTLCLESIKQQWASFWQWVGAEGDFEGSLAAWDVKRNTTRQRQMGPPQLFETCHACGRPHESSG